MEFRREILTKDTILGIRNARLVNQNSDQDPTDVKFQSDQDANSEEI